MLFAGCTKRYIVTYDLQEKLPEQATCQVGYMLDELSGDISEDKKPTKEDIEKFKGYIYEALEKSEVFKMLGNDQDSEYEVNGRLIEYKKGSGF